MGESRDQAEQQLSPTRQRLRAAADNVDRLTRELKAERQLRDIALVELYEGGVRVDTIADDAGVTRARVLEIVGNT